MRYRTCIGDDGERAGEEASDRLDRYEQHGQTGDDPQHALRTALLQLNTLIKPAASMFDSVFICMSQLLIMILPGHSLLLTVNQNITSADI